MFAKMTAEAHLRARAREEEAAAEVAASEVSSVGYVMVHEDFDIVELTGSEYI